jgi:ABC-type sugar transport system permease subunit
VTQARVAPADKPPHRRAVKPPGRRRLPDLGPLPWIGPALLLIFAVVLWPAFEMARTSVLEISRSGLARGFIGLENFERLFADPDLPGILMRTLTWVVIVVGVTILVSLGLASLLNAAFPGRRLVRWALIIPWAASVVMTATIWRWMLDGFYGIINRILLDLGLLAGPINDWLGNPSSAFIWLMFVAIFVSLPFTTYVLLAGLQSIPKDIYEAAEVDGATGRHSYRFITLPLLRPALLVAAIINMINVFNSFPIIWAMTRGGPGSLTDTTTTHMYKLAFQLLDVGQSAAMAMVNFGVILVFVLLYLRVVDWRRA